MKKSMLALSLLTLTLTACTDPKTNPPSDTTPPTVSLTVSHNGTAVKLNAAASDANGVDRVEFYVGNTLQSTDTTAPYEAAFMVPAGVNTFTAKAFDKAGNNASDTETVTINQTNPPATNTLYQGVWGYAYGQANSPTSEDEGAVAFVDEEAGNFGRVAVGAYGNNAKTKLGVALMGPISKAGALEVFFTKDTSDNVKPFLIAVDDNDHLETVGGRNTFLGSGVLTDDAGNALKGIIFVMVQYTTEKPANATEQAAVQQKANALAAQYLQSYAPVSAQKVPDFSQLKLNTASLLER